MSMAPDSYLDCRRPPLMEAMELEGGTINEGIDSLTKKGYFTPRPRPWKLGYKNRGHGRGDWAVLDKFDDLVVEAQTREDAELIIASVNSTWSKILFKIRMLKMKYFAKGGKHEE